MLKTSQEDLERERLSAAINALRAKIHERIPHPPNLSEDIRIQMKADADAKFKDGSIARALTNAIDYVREASISVRTGQQAQLFSNATRDILIQLLTTDPVTHSGALPNTESDSIFYPDVWVDHQVLINVLLHLVEDCKMRAERQKLDDTARTAWTELILIINNLIGHETVMSQADAERLINQIVILDRHDKSTLIVRQHPTKRPRGPQPGKKTFKEETKAAMLNLWNEYRVSPIALSKMANYRGIRLNLEGRRVSYKDVFLVCSGTYEMKKHGITSLEDFVKCIHAAQTKKRRTKRKKR